MSALIKISNLPCLAYQSKSIQGIFFVFDKFLHCSVLDKGNQEQAPGVQKETVPSFVNPSKRNAEYLDRTAIAWREGVANHCFDKNQGSKTAPPVCLMSKEILCHFFDLESNI